MADARCRSFLFHKKAGDDPDKSIRKVFTFEEMSKGGYWLAASTSVPDATIDKLRTALEEFKTTPEYKNILANWGLSI